MLDPRLAAILDRSGDPATVAWALEGKGDLTKIADPQLAIDAAEAAGNAAALQAVVNPKPLRKAAAAALHRMRSRGVKVEPKVAPVAFTLGTEALDVPSRAFLGLPDTDGEVPMVLTATSHSGTCLMEMFLGTADGHVQHGHCNRSELRDIWKTLEADPNLREIPFTAGLHLAFRRLGAKGDHGFAHLLSHVPAEVQAAAKGALSPAAGVDEEIGSDRMWILPAKLVAKPALEQGMEKMLQGTPENPEAVDAWVPDAADVALTGEAREAFADAADWMAVIYGQHGRLGAAADAERVAGLLRADAPGRDLLPVMNATKRAVANGAMRMLQDMMAEQQQMR